LRDDWDKDEAFEFAFKALVYMVRFQQSIMEVLVEVYGNIFLERSVKLSL
jgi:hypothetical protein